MHLHKKVLSIALAFSALHMLTACTQKIGGNDYSIRGIGDIGEVLRGTVVSVKPITVSGKPTEQQGQLGTGAIIGAGAGGVAGSLIGRGATPWIAGTLGALAGGAAGHLIEQKSTEQQGFVYEVKLDQGGSVSISQGIEPVLSVGQRVKVITGTKDRSRVLPE